MSTKPTTRRPTGFDPKPTKPTVAPFRSTVDLGNPARVKAALAPLWQRLGQKPRYPIDDAELLVLAKVGQYELSLGILAKFIARGYVKPVCDATGRRQWTRDETLVVLLHAERLRCWRLAPSIHDGKKGTVRLQREAAEREGRLDDLRKTLRAWEPGDIVLEIATADDAERRIDLLEAWRLRTEMEN